MKLQFISGKPITTTNFSEAKPLGINGQFVLENWHILYELLKNNISPECASLLLEPQVDRGRGVIDWYLPDENTKLPLKQLSREEALQRVNYYIAQGQKFANNLLNSSEVALQQKGQLLLEALQFPNENAIIITPYGPALIQWGHEKSKVSSKSEIVTAKGKEVDQNRMVILPPPISPFKYAVLLKNTWPWLASIFLLILLMLLPWWEGIIPIDYCRYYWLGPIIIFILLLPILGFLIKNRYDHQFYFNKGKI